MWKFNTSTDTLVTADSATQTRGLNRSVQYLKSMEGILRVVTVVCRSVKEEQLAFLPVLWYAVKSVSELVVLHL